MLALRLFKLAGTAAITLLMLAGGATLPARAQQQQVTADDPAAAASDVPAPLDADEMEILVARIALYPDDLVAVITASALYPLQVVEAGRYLESYAKDKSLKPKDGWDGSVISLLNYPEIVKMMSEDLDWTQALGQAIAYQQQDALIAIQQLREEAVAKGVIKTDDKVKVDKQAGNVIIEPASPEVIYVPRYDPQVLYVADYPPAPIAYYPDPYPYYWNPGATFFAGAVTGAIWAAAVDWDDWDVWGGHWNGPDIDIDCNHCLNNIDLNGKVNFGDIDWKNVDRSKIRIDRDQFASLERNGIRNSIKAGGDNALRDRTANIKRENVAGRSSKGKAQTADIRKSTLEGLKPGPAASRPAVQKPANVKREVSKPKVQKPAAAARPAGKVKPAARVDNRPRQATGLGDVDRGKVSQMRSDRGRQSMGGGLRGGAHKAVKRPTGRRH